MARECQGAHEATETFKASVAVKSVSIWLITETSHVSKVLTSVEWEVG